MIEIYIKRPLNDYNQEKLEERLRSTLKDLGIKEFHIRDISTENEITESKPNEIRISYEAIKDYLKEYGYVELTEESFEAFKSWLYDDIHEWLKDNAKSFSEHYSE